MKKLIAIILALLIVMSMIFGCAQTEKNQTDKISIVCTIFPQYDWAKQILGDRAEDIDLTLLLSSGIDLHSYLPSAEDIVKISSCDMLIYVGGESDAWVDEALKTVTNKDIVVINLLETLGDTVRHEEIKEGMEHSHDHGELKSDNVEDHSLSDWQGGRVTIKQALEKGEPDKYISHQSEENESFEMLLTIENLSPTYFQSEDTNEKVAEAMSDHDHSAEGESDEHVWLSLKNAQALCTYIAEGLCVLDPNNEKVYRANANGYNDKLSTLDDKYKEAVSNSVQKTLLFGDRFSFRYLVDDYGLDYFAAFPGCSAETEASFDTVIFLANKVDELGLGAVMVTESSDSSIAKTIISNTTSKNQQIFVMDSMQSITTADIEKGATYLSVMENNLNALKDALK